MEKKEYSLTDKVYELIKKYFGAEFLSELKRDVIANKIAAATSQSCGDGGITVVSCQDINDDDDNQRIPEGDCQLKCVSVSVVGDTLVPDLFKFGKLEMKNTKAVVSVKDVSYIDMEAKTVVDALCITQDTPVQAYQYGDETQVECFLEDGGCWPKKEVKMGALTEIGDRFEGGWPMDDLCLVLQWKNYDGGGNLSKLLTVIN